MKKIVLVASFLLLCSSSVFASNASSEDIKEGERLYNYWCVHCHGVGMPGTNALSVLYKGTDTPSLVDKRTDLDYDLVSYFVRYGKHSMPFFRKTELTDKQIEFIADYIEYNSNQK